MGVFYKMANDLRVKRVSEQIKKEISDIVQNELKDPRIKKGIISVTRVRISSDLRHAKVFVSIYGDETLKEEIIEGLKNASGFIRKHVGSRIRLRYIPEIIFELDESIEYGVNISELIKKVNLSEGDDNNQKNN